MKTSATIYISYFIWRLKGSHAIVHFQTIYSLETDRDFIQFNCSIYAYNNNFSIFLAHSLMLIYRDVCTRVYV